jgi:GTP-binding protein Era
VGHKAGFVNIIGSPNVGKSTLMNALVGERLSIITSKAQTTRHRIMGIVSDDDCQIVYSDTPGVLNASYKMHEAMMKFVHTALADADILLVITDVFETKMNNEQILEKLKDIDTPVMLLINKVDLVNQEKVLDRMEFWKVQLPKAEIHAVSALHEFNLEIVLSQIKKMLPESPAFFDKDEMTDKSMRFFVTEIIREKILENYTKEIPYSCEVVCEAYKDEGHIVHIRAEIIVMRDTQKGIIIGHKGERLKKVGTDSRIDIEKFIDNKVFLDLHVRVDKDWRDKENKLKKYGYTQ